ncbi:MAG: endonuclease [Bacteroidia bacterium]|nr:endonuclease [Bacteroidia bacterium]
MPEGPSIVIAVELTKQFTGKKVISVSGNSKIDFDRTTGKKIIDIRSWGKHYLLCFKDFSIKIHFLLFGSYTVNEKKDKPEKLGLHFAKGGLYFYACAIKILEGNITEHFNWKEDIMSEEWDSKIAVKKIKDLPKELACDILLNQDVFAGVGNIIKNEVLYRVHIHPESKVGKIPAARIRNLIKEARHYSFQFLDWKKDFTLKKQWLAYSQKNCKRCELPLSKKYTGKTKRKTYFCTNCQILYK